ncbi:MarR family transcriptional regulator [Streptosporangium lutulentum]|uniref:DNA-binding transcriptional regulator GbsR (MarR family) n=1 Tax=Streptosporangium lutulentum TaxID=1461250 RepID=A0ABT9QMJ9_9ACTN|nr:helix-turn-helix domain-containing protein [Streptosporangium lutulentum]MDP9847988.1 DNA-binding transcriptional regulator GbsR (MarR family) [Streptosporangium lutulentum]
MPGGRLTHQDRRQIADGLAEGLTYTEIAARLDRPLSTVTREVARNGGSEGYRADQAHEATRERARRSRSAPGERDVEAVDTVEEQFTEILISTGLSRMTARVLAGLYLTDSGSLTAAELTRHLQVSPASVSKAIGELEQQEMVRRERDPRRRRDRYIIDADALFRAWMAGARQNALLADFAHRAAETLGAASPAGGRLRDVGDFFDHVGQAMLQAAEQWREAYNAKQEL